MTASTTNRHQRNPLAWLILVCAIWLAAYFIFLPRLTHLGLWLQIPSGSLEGAVSFFLYEVPKVLLLLTAVVFGVGVLRTFISPERTRKWLRNRHLLPIHHPRI